MHSSTSSSEITVESSTPPAAPWKLLLSRTAILTVILLAIAEVILHVPAIRNVLPPSRIYYSNDVEPRLQALNSTLRSEGRVDVLFIGSSIVRTNFRPIVFDSVVQEVAGREVVSFNGGLSGLPPAGVRLYLQHFFLPRVNPTVVFQGIRYPELVLSHPASSVESLAHGLVEPLWMDPTLPNRVRATIREHVELFQFQGLLAGIVQDRRFPPRWAEPYEIDSRGWNARHKDVTERVSRGEMEPLESHDDAVWDRDAAQRGLEIVREIARLVRSRGSEFVLVNVPEHAGRYGTPASREDYREYLNLVERFSEEMGIPFIDVTNGDPSAYGKDAWFNDGHHMTAEGAHHFTVPLARRWARQIAGAGPSVVPKGVP